MCMVLSYLGKRILVIKLASFTVKNFIPLFPCLKHKHTQTKKKNGICQKEKIVFVLVVNLLDGCFVGDSQQNSTRDLPLLFCQVTSYGATQSYPCIECQVVVKISLTKLLVIQFPEAGDIVSAREWLLFAECCCLDWCRCILLHCWVGATANSATPPDAVCGRPPCRQLQHVRTTVWCNEIDVHTKHARLITLINNGKCIVKFSLVAMRGPTLRKGKNCGATQRNKRVVERELSSLCPSPACAIAVPMSSSASPERTSLCAPNFALRLKHIRAYPAGAATNDDGTDNASSTINTDFGSVWKTFERVCMIVSRMCMSWEVKVPASLIERFRSVLTF